MKKLKAFAFARWLLLLPIPALWCVLGHYGALTFLENRFLDWRFQFRGERDAPVKIVYVDVDSLSLTEIGGWPWSRAYFARMAKALIEEGQARAVGFDFVFSDEGVPESVDEQKLIEGNLEFGRYLASKSEPPVALAAAYGGHQFVDFDGKRRFRELPLLATESRPLARIESPEVPTFMLPGKRKFYNPPVVGLIDTVQNGSRVVPAWAPSNIGRNFHHMAIELARLYWRLPYGSIQVKGNTIEFVRPDQTVQATVPLRDGQLLDINWFTSWRSGPDLHWEFSKLFPMANALAVGRPDDKLRAQQVLAQAGLKDSVVLIGPTDPLFQDLAPTSLDSTPVPKVSVHGNLLKTIISGQFLRHTPTWRGIAWVDVLLVFALTALVTGLALITTRRSWASTLCKGLAAVAVVAYVVIAFEVFKSGHYILPLTAPLGAAFTTSFAGLIWQVVEEQKAKGRIKGMFGTYLSPQLVEQMVESGEDPQLGGHDAEITAYFSDIQSFSSFSEVLGSRELVQLMNEYLTACTDIVTAQGGTLDKYIGDAVVAMFGAPLALPDHAYRACIATQLVHRRLAELRAKWTAEGDKWPEIVKNMQSRIGLNSGVCTIGNMGSATRFNYTMMGDDVNLAARMESGAKSWGVYTMCTETTKSRCEAHGDRVVFRSLARIVVKGRNQAVPVYEIVGLKENVTDQTRECVALFEQGLTKYYARDWAGAAKLFEQSRALEFNVPGKTPGVVSNPSKIYLEKIVPEAIEENFGPDWDGRYVMKEK